jgi:predicted lysophospholipase L1 biosynthesis ABC-type transport system permease subunit
MGNTLLAGRDFDWTDIYEQHHVAIVSENLARHLWGDPRLAIGKRIHESLATPLREIVGVVSDERDDGFDNKPPEIAIWPILMDNFEDGKPSVRRSLIYMIRTPRAGSRAFLDELKQAVWSVNRNLPLENVRTLEEICSRSLARTSFTLVMLAIAGAMALLLGITGIYGVIAYSVSQRRREIGIRIALGAQKPAITGMFVRYAVRVAGVGIACGLVGAVVLSRLMKSLLFDVHAIDPLTYAAVALGLVATAVLASYVPALHATTVNPIDTLRSE